MEPESPAALSGVVPSPTSTVDSPHSEEFLTPRTPSHLDGPFGSNFELYWIEEEEDSGKESASQMKGHEDEIAETWGTPELCSALAMLVPSLASLG